MRWSAPVGSLAAMLACLALAAAARADDPVPKDEAPLVVTSTDPSIRVLESRRIAEFEVVRMVGPGSAPAPAERPGPEESFVRVDLDAEFQSGESWDLRPFVLREGGHPAPAVRPVAFAATTDLPFFTMEMGAAGLAVQGSVYLVALWGKDGKPVPDMLGPGRIWFAWAQKGDTTKAWPGGRGSVRLVFRVPKAAAGFEVARSDPGAAPADASDLAPYELTAEEASSLPTLQGGYDLSMVMGLLDPATGQLIPNVQAEVDAWRAAVKDARSATAEDRAATVRNLVQALGDARARKLGIVFHGADGKAKYRWPRPPAAPAPAAAPADRTFEGELHTGLHRMDGATIPVFLDVSRGTHPPPPDAAKDRTKVLKALLAAPADLEGDLALAGWDQFSATKRARALGRDVLVIVVRTAVPPQGSTRLKGAASYVPGATRLLKDLAAEFGAPSERETWSGEITRDLGIDGVVSWWGEVGVAADAEGTVSHVLLRGILKPK